MQFDSYIVSETKTAFSVPLTKETLRIKKTFRQKAFTLAETLITLSIIGVVAAITVPTLMSNVNKKIYVTGLKKAYNQLQHVAKLVPMVSGCSADDYACSGGINGDNFTQILKHVKIYKCDWNLGGWGSTDCYLTPDGAVFQFEDSPVGYNSTIGVDINGKKGPNLWGRDRFVFDAVELSGAAYDSDCVGLIYPRGGKVNEKCYDGYVYDLKNHNCTTQTVKEQSWKAFYCAGRVLDENSMNY